MELVVRPDRRARWGDLVLACAIGRNGIGAAKREGDGLTPAGAWPLRRVLYRPDRVERPETALPCDPIAPSDGWCDAPGDIRYNRPVTLPYPASAEKLWREDRLYDLLAVIGHNDEPAMAGMGSAVFLHVAGDGYAPTDGCVALSLEDLTQVLGQWRPADRIVIAAAWRRRSPFPGGYGSRRDG